MKTYKTITLTSVTMALLSACGGTTTPVLVTPPPLNLAAASFSEGSTAIAYDPAAGTLSVNGTAVNMPTGSTSIVNGSATVFTSGAPLHTTAVAQSGDVFAVSSTTNVGPDVTAFTYGRRGPTTLAQTGSATFSGDYAGFYVNSAGGAVDWLIDGDVSLAANLATNTITGGITNRRSFTPAGVLSLTTGANDAVIAGGTISADGTFNASMTGGERTFNSGANQYVAETGSVDGTFGGLDGANVAGVVRMRQTTPGFELTEVGSFIATRN